MHCVSHYCGLVLVIGMLGVQLQINHESCTKRTEKFARVLSTRANFFLLVHESRDPQSTWNSTGRVMDPNVRALVIFPLPGMGAERYGRIIFTDEGYSRLRRPQSFACFMPMTETFAPVSARILTNLFLTRILA